jgi:catechol 2,3-dioxygenase-like lactoylglutathione lyase family enzyme
LRNLAREQGAETFVLVSASVASVSSPFFYPRIKGEIERDIELVGFKSLTIVRPSLIGGERNEPRFREGIPASPLIGKFGDVSDNPVLREVRSPEGCLRRKSGQQVEERVRIVPSTSWRSNMHPNTEGILESSLYVIDVAHSVQFYEKIFGFQVIRDFGERGCALMAGSRQVLLLFKKGGSRDIVSPHDGDGELHLAFAIAADELTSWEAWLAENGIAVEETRTWEFGGHSLYFRDPDRHLLEIATPGIWSIY